MLLAAVIVLGLLALCVWVAILAVRVPRKPEHEREPRKLPDPALTSHKGGQGGL